MDFSPETPWAVRLFCCKREGPELHPLPTRTLMRDLEGAFGAGTISPNFQADAHSD